MPIEFDQFDRRKYPILSTRDGYREWESTYEQTVHDEMDLHPYFIMATGMPTHFHRESGEPVAIETHVHLFSDHVAAATRAGLTLIEMDENVIDDRWIAKKPRWEKHRGQLISFVFVWRKA